MTASKNTVILACIVCFCLLFSFHGQAAGFNSEYLSTQDNIDKDYYIVLIGFVFFLPEIVELHFSDNGTFSLKSDLWDQAAVGTYENNILLLKGNGTTGNFYDVDFDEYIEMNYNFTSHPLGLRDFFMMGIGSREITLENGDPILEPFIFEGPGF